MGAQDASVTEKQIKFLNLALQTMQAKVELAESETAAAKREAQRIIAAIKAEDEAQKAELIKWLQQAQATPRVAKE